MRFLQIQRIISLVSMRNCRPQDGLSFFRLCIIWTLISSSLMLAAQSSSYSESDWVDLAQIDTLLDLSDHVVYHIDEPPFSEYKKIAGKSFTNLGSHELNEQWINGLNKRFWLKFNLHNSDTDAINDYKIYLGISDRVFLYEIEGDEIIEIGKKGANYRNAVNPEFSLYFDFPIHLSPGDSVSFLAHLSNAYFPEAFESIDPMIIKRGYEEFLYKPSRTVNKLGLLYLSTLTIILVFLIIGIALFILLKDRSILAFSLLCFSFILYYIRDLEKLISSVTFLNVPDEFLSRSEPLARTFITLAFLIFTFTYFKKFNYRRNYKIASIMVILFGIIGGLRTLIFSPLDVLIAYTSIDTFLHNGFMTSSMILTFLILRTIWYSAEYYSKFYIVGTLVYSIFNYGGIIIENLYAHDGAIEHLNKYASITGVLLFTLIIAYMIMQRLIMTEKQVILKTAEVENLSQINTAKSEFYTNVTHEFRTPLTVILGMAASIKKNTVEKNLIIKNAKTLLSLVNQILSLSKNQEHATSLNYVNTDIVNYLRSIIEPLVYHAEQKYIDLVLEAEHEEIRMDFDSSVIQKVINNLVYNAIKFSPPHTTILLKVSIQGEKLKCVISDEGIGIEAEQLPHIFERFYQADPSFNSKSDIGSGIGLSIVKETIENMQGTITVESVIGEGTKFIIFLPLENSVAISILDEKSDLSSQWNHLESQTNRGTNAKETILIIEDNEDVMLYTQRCLKDKYIVLTAGDGKEGLNKAISELPDLILSDVMMPIINGFELTRRLKKDIKTDHIPVVLLTAKATQSEMIEGLSAGADDYIYKPFDQKELLLRIENIIIGRKRAAEKNRLLSKQEDAPLPPWLTQFETIILQNIGHTITSEWISEKMQLSRSQIHRKVKSLTGLTPTLYVKQIKMKRAKKMLLSSESSIDTIAEDLGFNSTSYFSASFKEIHGLTPSEWRQQKRH